MQMKQSGRNVLPLLGFKRKLLKKATRKGLNDGD